MNASIRAASQKLTEKTPFSRFQNPYALPARRESSIKEKFELLLQEFPTPYLKSDEEIFSNKILIDIKLPKKQPIARSSYSPKSNEKPLVFSMELLEEERRKAKEESEKKPDDLMEMVPMELLPEYKAKKKAEEEEAEAAAKAKAEEEKLRQANRKSLLGHIKDFVWPKDTDGNSNSNKKKRKKRKK